MGNILTPYILTPYNIIPYNSTPYNIVAYILTPYNITPYNTIPNSSTPGRARKLVGAGGGAGFEKFCTRAYVAAGRWHYFMANRGLVSKMSCKDIK